MPKINPDELTAVQEQARAWRLLISTLSRGERWHTKYAPGSPERLDCVTQMAIKEVVDHVWQNREIDPETAGRWWFETLRPRLQAVRSMIRGAQMRGANQRKRKQEMRRG